MRVTVTGSLPWLWTRTWRRLVETPLWTVAKGLASGNLMRASTSDEGTAAPRARAAKERGAACEVEVEVGEEEAEEEGSATTAWESV